MRLFVLIGLLFNCSLYVTALRVCGKYGEYNKLNAMHRLLVCFLTDFCDDDPRASEPELLVKTTKQLLYKSGKNLREFRQCGWSQIRESFSIDYQVALNESQLLASPINTACMKRDDVCLLHKDYLYPVMCLIESKCDRMLSQLTYAFLYGIGQLNAETQAPLDCNQDSAFDVNRETIFETSFCHKMPSNNVNEYKQSKSLLDNWF